MQEVFNLSKIKKLVDSEHPQAIIVVDTNIVIDVPDFRQWKTTVKEPIFVMPDIVIIELERLKRKNRKEEEPTKFDEAIKWLNWLLDQGDITEGILIAEVGWFISISSSDEEAINSALSQLGAIVEVFHKNDSKFLILTRELSELMPDNTVVFYTKDYNLYNIAVTRGFPACRFEGFPMAGIERWIEKKKPEPLDWDTVLTDMQRDTKDKSIEIEFTLMSKKLVRDILNPTYSEEMSQTLEKLDYIVAEGYGCIHTSDEQIQFLWRIPFKPFTSETLASDNLRGEPDPVEWSLMIDEPDMFPFGPPGVMDLDKVDLNFIGKDKKKFSHLQKEFSDVQFELLAILCDCVSPLAYIHSKPTLQSPICIAEWFIISRITGHMYSFDSKQDAIKFIENSRDYEGLLANLSILLSQDPDPGNTIADFLDAVTSCWNIGHTIRTRMLYPSND